LVRYVRVVSLLQISLADGELLTVGVVTGGGVGLVTARVHLHVLLTVRRRRYSLKVSCWTAILSVALSSRAAQLR